MKLIAFATMAAWMAVAVSPATAAHQSLPAWSLSIEKTCPSHYQGIAFYRGKVWRLERQMGTRITRASYAEHLVGSCAQVVPFVKRWQTIATQRWAEYKAWKKRMAARPAYYDAWMCIHRHEGAWNDAGDPYWGGLQMDRGFMKTYGSDMISRYGGYANVWPPLVQMQVAERAYNGYAGYEARGFHPWPNTARYCGLL